MDGTLLDSMGLWLNAGVYYLESLGITAEPGLGETLMEMNMIQGAEYIKKNYNLSLTLEQICDGINNTLKNHYAHKIQLKPGVLDFLNILKEKHIPCAIATNTDRELFTPCLARLGITDYFQEIITCSEQHTSKNHPEIFYYTAEKLKSAPQTTLVFEDALYALKTARNAGFQTVGIYDQYTQRYTDPAKIMHNSTIYLQSWFNAEKVIFGD